MSETPDKTAGVDPMPVVLPPVPANAPKVLLCLPWQKMTNPMTAFSVMNLVDRRRTATMLDFGDAFVAHSRNNCATRFLDTPMEWMLMIDDDMIPPFGHAGWFNAYTGLNLPNEYAGMNALDRLLSHQKTLVGALYFGRHLYGAPMYAEGANIPTEADYARRAPYNIIKPTRWVATGCMLIHRSVFEDIERKFPRLSRSRNPRGGQWFTSSEHTALDWIDRAAACLTGNLDGEKAYQAKGILAQASAEAAANSSLGMGEDVQFCIRAKEAGHQPFVDMGCICGHVGQQSYGMHNTKRKHQ